MGIHPLPVMLSPGNTLQSAFRFSYAGLQFPPYIPGTYYLKYQICPNNHFIFHTARHICPIFVYPLHILTNLQMVYCKGLKAYVIFHH